jgi:hypothetical protein
MQPDVLAHYATPVAAYQVGRAAFWSDKTIADNPFGSGALADAWLGGLLDAEQSLINGRDVRIRRPALS